MVVRAQPRRPFMNDLSKALPEVCIYREGKYKTRMERKLNEEDQIIVAIRGVLGTTSTIVPSVHFHHD
jgi:hypothetical protein